MRLALAAQAAVLVVTSTGCAQLFGIDNTTGADANTDFATATVQRVSIGASLVKAPQDMSAQTAQFLAADGTATPGVLSGTDTFTADIAGTPAALFSLPDMQVPQRMWATGARVQRGNYTVLEHPNPTPPTAASRLGVQVTTPSPYVTGESFIVQAVGAWMQHSLISTELPAPDTNVSTIAPAGGLDYSMFTTMISGGSKNAIVAADVVLVLRYAASKLTGVFQTQFDQTDGTDPVAGAMVAVPASSMLMATIDPAALTTRFSAVRPATGAVSLPWRVTAAPGHSVGDTNGVRLVNGTALATDAMVTTTFGNPFESLDWKAVFVLSANTSRAFAYMENGMMANVSLASSLTHVAEPSTTLNLNMPAGLPITVRANAATLTSDGMALPLDTSQPVVVDAIIDRPTNTLYYMQLVELGLDTSGASPVATKKIVLDAFTVGEPKFTLPGSLFVVGKSYFIQFRCIQGGYTAADTGDLQTITLPFSYGSLDSAVFTVGMP